MAQFKMCNRFPVHKNPKVGDFAEYKTSYGKGPDAMIHAGRFEVVAVHNNTVKVKSTTRCIKFPSSMGKCPSATSYSTADINGNLLAVKIPTKPDFKFQIAVPGDNQYVKEERHPGTTMIRVAGKSYKAQKITYSTKSSLNVSTFAVDTSSYSTTICKSLEHPDVPFRVIKNRCITVNVVGAETTQEFKLLMSLLSLNVKSALLSFTPSQRLTETLSEAIVSKALTSALSDKNMKWKTFNPFSGNFSVKVKTFMENDLKRFGKR